MITANNNFFRFADNSYPQLVGGSVHTAKIIGDILRKEKTTPNQIIIDSLIHRPVVNKSNYFFVVPGYTSQADLIFYPQGSNRYKYILAIIDVVSRQLAAVPVINKEAETIAAAFKKILDRGFKTQIVYTDSGSEFNNRIVKGFLNSRNIEIRYTVPGRHNQLAIIDAYIGLLNQILVGIHSYRDLADNKPQRDTKRYNWVDNLPLAVAQINDANGEDPRFNKTIADKIAEYHKLSFPKIGKKEKILSVGDRVYPPYLYPNDTFTGKRTNTFERGRFRKGDPRFNIKRPYTIGFVSLRLGQPVRYLLNDPNGKLITNISYLAINSRIKNI